MEASTHLRLIVVHLATVKIRRTRQKVPSKKTPPDAQPAARPLSLIAAHLASTKIGYTTIDREPAALPQTGANM